MLKDYLILKSISNFIIPYIFLYGLYIQVNGEISPGGGFQAGVIFASCLIAFNLIYGQNILNQYFPISLLSNIAVIGVLIYTCTGLYSLIWNDNFLDYYSLHTNKISAQFIGIFLIELGVGLTVASVMTLIYSMFNKE